MITINVEKDGAERYELNFLKDDYQLEDVLVLQNQSTIPLTIIAYKRRWIIPPLGFIKFNERSSFYLHRIDHKAVVFVSATFEDVLDLGGSQPAA